MAEYFVKNEEGKYQDDLAYQNVYRYITRADKTPDNYVIHAGVDSDNAVMEYETVANVYGKNEGVRLRHSIISFKNGEAYIDQVYRVMEMVCWYYFNQGYQIVGAVHQDTDQLHIHFMMNQVSYIDGRKYEGTREQHKHFMNQLKRFCFKMNINIYYVANN